MMGFCVSNAAEKYDRRSEMEIDEDKIDEAVLAPETGSFRNVLP